MAKSAILSVKIVTDAKEGTKGLDTYSSKLDKFAGGAKKLQGPAALVIGGLGAAALAAGKLAANAEQNVGAVNTVFGKAAGKVLEYSKTSADAVGMSAASYNGLAANIGGSLKSAGYSQDEMAGKTEKLIGASADLASVFGGDAKEAAAAMGAGLRGEFDSLERFGIFMSASAVDAELAATGQDKLTGAALAAAKKQATTNLMLEQAGQYAGNFAREADTAAGAQQRATAKFEDAATQLGEQLLPVMTKAAELGAGMATWIGQNIPLITTIALVIGGLAAGILLVNGAITVFRTVAAVATAAQWLWNAAMAANPIGLIVLAIAGLVAGIVWAYNNVAWFRDGVNAAMAWIRKAVDAVVAFFRAAWAGAIRLVAGFIVGLVGTWNATIARIRAVVAAVVAWVTSRWNAGVAAVVRAVLRIVAGWNSTIARIRAVVAAVVAWVGSRWSAGVAGVVRTVLRVATGWSNAVGKVRGIVSGVVGWIGDRFRSVYSTISGGAANAFGSVIRAIQNVIGWVRDAIGWLGGLFSKQSSASRAQGAFGNFYMRPAMDVPEDGKPFYMTAAGLQLQAPGRAAGGLGVAAVQNVEINLTVNGAVDARSSARQIIELLRGELVSTGVRVKGEPVW